MADEFGGIDAAQLVAAVNANPQLRIELQLIRAPAADEGKAYFYADVQGAQAPGDSVVLSIPDVLWAMLGRRGSVVVRLAIEDET